MDDDAAKFNYFKAEEPVAAHEREVSSGNREDDDPPYGLWLSQDAALFAGGTAVMPGASAVSHGGLPAPWVAPVPHVDRLVGGDKFTVRMRPEDE